MCFLVYFICVFICVFICLCFCVFYLSMFLYVRITTICTTIETKRRATQNHKKQTLLRFGGISKLERRQSRLD